MLVVNGSTAFGNRISAMTETRQPWWLWPLLLVLLPLVVVAGVLWLVAAVLLQLVVWVTWCPRGRYVLVVYSNSPIWQGYFEQNVLPAVGSRGVVLNWSERKRWPYSLPVALFRFFGELASSTHWPLSFSHCVASPIPFLQPVPGVQARPPSGSRKRCGVNFSKCWTGSRHPQKLHDMPQTRPSSCGAKLFQLPEPSRDLVPTGAGLVHHPSLACNFA